MPGVRFDLGAWQKRALDKVPRAPVPHCPICGCQDLEIVQQLVQTVLGDPTRAMAQLQQTGTLPILVELRFICNACGYILAFDAEKATVPSEETEEKPRIALASDADLRKIDNQRRATEEQLERQQKKRP